MKKLLFVDDEPRILQAMQRQLHSMRGEWQMTFVGSGQQALETLSQEGADVIVTDMMMPGMDGAQLLDRVTKLYPQTVRVVLSGHADREAVLRLVGPAHQYLSKPCQAEELRAALSRAFALRGLLESDVLKQLTAKMQSIPVLPTLYTELTQELQKEEPAMERIGDIISRDVGMTTKILQLVNSAFFGLPQPLSSAHEATVYLGLSTLRAIVLSVQVFSQFDQKQIPQFSIEKLAQHSWIAGIFARKIGEMERLPGHVIEQCFVAGMLHDVGRLILAAGLPLEYAKAIDRAGLDGRNLMDIEREQFYATHAEVGAYLLGLWGLPGPVVEAVALHHTPAAAAVGGMSAVLAVHVADVLADEMEGRDPVEQLGIDTDALQRFNLVDRLPDWREKCLEEP